MLAFRIADRRFPLFDGMGARLIGGRWNSPGRPVIYAAQTFAATLLEVLVHSNLGKVPKTHAVIEITIPGSLQIETVHEENLPGLDAEDQRASRLFGDQWLSEQRSAVLLVPSLVTRGREQNLVLNPLHPGFSEIRASQPFDVQWDVRLFQRQAG